MSDVMLIPISVQDVKSILLSGSGSIAVSAITSVAVVGLSFLYKSLLQENDFKNDYYKKIIDKRMKAYEELQLFIWNFATVRKANDESQESPHESGYDVFESFHAISLMEDAITKLLHARDGELWFSKQTREAMHDLNKILANIFTIVENPSKSTDYIDKYNLALAKYNNENLVIKQEIYDQKNRLLLFIGISVYDEINMKTTNIKNSIVQDMYKLDEVKEFLEQNKK